MFKGPQVCGAPPVFKGMVWLWAVPMLNHIPASSGSLELLLAIAPNHQRATGRLIRLCPDMAASAVGGWIRQGRAAGLFIGAQEAMSCVLEFHRMAASTARGWHACAVPIDPRENSLI